jgi:hypothetical protein
MKTQALLFTLTATISFNQLFTLAHAAQLPGGAQTLTHLKLANPKEMQDLKDKLKSLEDDLKKKQSLIDTKSSEAKTANASQTPEEADQIKKLQQLLDEQKKEIEKLKLQIKEAETKEPPKKEEGKPVAEADKEAEKKKANQEITVALCQAQKHANELESELKKLLKDKEDIMKELKEIRLLSEKSRDKKDDKPSDKNDESKPSSKEIARNTDDKKIKRKGGFSNEQEKFDYSDYSSVAMMGQITSLLLSQQQAQTQMQMQMFSMLNTLVNKNSRSNYNSSENLDPYNFYGIQSVGSIGYGYPSLTDSFNYYGNNIGISHYNYNNPFVSNYSGVYGTSNNQNGQGNQNGGLQVSQPQLPNNFMQMNRQPTSDTNNSSTPQIRGYDFNQSSAPELQQLQRTSI